MLTVCTAISSPGPFEQQAVPRSISVLGYSLPALAAVGQDAAEPPAPHGGISYTPGIFSRHQFHNEISSKKSTVLNTKKPNFFIVCYLNVDFSWSKTIMSRPLLPKKHSASQATQPRASAGSAAALAAHLKANDNR